MVAYTFTTPGGFPGDITRHDFTTTTEVALTANPPTAFGVAVTLDAATGAVRPIGTGDTATTPITGVVVRSFPMQMATAPGPYGQTPLGQGNTPPSPPQPLDVLRRGGIRVAVVGASAKGGTVYIWTAATAAPHIQGGFEAVNPTTNGFALGANVTFNSPPDGNGTAELYFNL